MPARKIETSYRNLHDDVTQIRDTFDPFPHVTKKLFLRSKCEKSSNHPLPRCVMTSRMNVPFWVSDSKERLVEKYTEMDVGRNFSGGEGGGICQPLKPGCHLGKSARI
jgi:hypothetical protein